MRYLFFYIGACLLISSCSSVEIPEQIIEERIRKEDQKVGRELFAEYIKNRVVINDGVLIEYYREIALRLIPYATEVADEPVSLTILKSKKDEWESYSSPGIHIAFSSEFLKNLDYESTLAAAIALELAYLQERLLVDQKEPRFRESLQGQKKPIQRAVKTLYQSGFDPRGLVSYWNLLQNKKKGVIQIKNLQYFATLTLSEISSYPPLIYPVIRSAKFFEMKARLAGFSGGAQ